MDALPDTVRELLDALGDPALIVRAGRTLAANVSARRLLGRAIEQQDVRLAIRHPEALSMILAGQATELDLTGIGSIERPWRLVVRPIAGDLVLARLIDRSAAAAAEKMRVDFVANASHELRTPLASIAGYAETLAEDGELAEDIRRNFGSTILGEARRMERIVDDLMSLSRIEAERFRAPRDNVDLGEVARLAAENHGGLAKQRRCSIELKLDDMLPPILGDFAQLCQAADNLVANAIRYGCAAKDCTVIVSTVRDDGRAVLAVRDNGEGISPEHLPFLTRRFYRVDAARSRDSGGTGLGLAIVKHIVERHRGTLEIKSRPGQGTTVEIRVPFARQVS